MIRSTCISATQLGLDLWLTCELLHAWRSDTSEAIFIQMEFPANSSLSLSFLHWKKVQSSSRKNPRPVEFVHYDVRPTGDSRFRFISCGGGRRLADQWVCNNRRGEHHLPRTLSNSNAHSIYLTKLLGPYSHSVWWVFCELWGGCDTFVHLFTFKSILCAFQILSPTQMMNYVKLFHQKVFGCDPCRRLISFWTSQRCSLYFFRYIFLCVRLREPRLLAAVVVQVSCTS